MAAPPYPTWPFPSILLHAPIPWHCYHVNTPSCSHPGPGWLHLLPDIFCPQPSEGLPTSQTPDPTRAFLKYPGGHITTPSLFLFIIAHIIPENISVVFIYLLPEIVVSTRVDCAPLWQLAMTKDLFLLSQVQGCRGKQKESYWNPVGRSQQGCSTSYRAQDSPTTRNHPTEVVNRATDKISLQSERSGKPIPCCATIPVPFTWPDT